MESMNFFQNEHTYTLAAIGLKKHYDKVFKTRPDANEFMYKLIRKYKLHIVEVYDDKHCKTYRCDNGVRFFIQRAY